MDTPLDLSQQQQRSSVIRALTLHPPAPPTHSTRANPDDAATRAESPSPSEPALPQCPNLNSNWVALKFGAAVGPNRMSYPREFKLMVIEYYHTHGANKYRTCKEFQPLIGEPWELEITKSMLNGWLSKMEKIRQSRPGSLKSGRSGRRPQFPDIEKQLFSIYTKVGNRWIRETARGLARSQCSEAELGGMCQFSERWLSNFKKRYGINLNKDWSSSASDSSDQPTTASAAPSNLGGESERGSETSECVEEWAGSPAPLVRPVPLLVPQPWTFPQHYEPGRRGRKVQFPQVEKVLHSRVVGRQAEGARISNRWLQEEARSLARELCPQALAEATKSARCMFSEHWLHNFKKRYRVSLKGPTSTHSDTSSAPPSPPQMSPEDGKAEGVDGAALLQHWQQWLLQQAYLSATQANPTPPPLNLAEWYNKTMMGTPKSEA